VRLFTAIFLPEAATAAVAALPRRVSSPRLRWIPPISLHLTLKFLGETRESRLPEIEDALSRATSACRPFRIGLSGGGAFPNDRRPRVFWVGISGDVVPLADLASRMASDFAEIGFPEEERAFAPHLTVARCRADARCLPADGEAFAAAAASLSVDVFPVEAVRLVRSHLDGTGARYESLRTFPLAA
jgi:2'-5' RNA ligase